MPATHLRITAKRDGHRRAGIRHPGHPVDHAIAGLEPYKIAMLKGDPQLVVHEVEIVPEPDPKTDPKAAK